VSYYEYVKLLRSIGTLYANPCSGLRILSLPSCYSRMNFSLWPPKSLPWYVERWQDTSLSSEATYQRYSVDKRPDSRRYISFVARRIEMSKSPVPALCFWPLRTEPWKVNSCSSNLSLTRNASESFVKSVFLLKSAASRFLLPDSLREVGRHQLASAVSEVWRTRCCVEGEVKVSLNCNQLDGMTWLKPKGKMSGSDSWSLDLSTWEEM
jgi:hypothetical protein